MFLALHTASETKTLAEPLDGSPTAFPWCMKILPRLILACLIAASESACDLSVDFPNVEYSTVSVHTVQYGTMPFHTKGRGMIVHIGPDSRARVQVLLSFARHLKIGHPASVKIVGIGGALPAQVIKIGESSGEAVPVELAFLQPLPHDVTVGDSADALIEYGKIENTLYMERGAFDKENAEVAVFRVDPDRTATRVMVRFGAIASELIEIKSGLHEEDKVIVTDMSRWTDCERIRLE